LLVDPNDASGNTLYAGSGEPNGSGDSEAGLGLFRSTDGGASWSLISASQPVAINRSIGAIAVVPGSPDTIYIGTAVARHGSASVNGGRRTPPDAPTLGVYKSTDGGAHWALADQLQSHTPPNPAPASSGVDWFQGGVTKLQLDPHDAGTVYAAIFGYGLWRSADAGATWTQVFATMNPADTFGDRVEFAATPVGAKTRIYLGDSSDDLGVSRVYRTDDAAAIVGDPNGAYDNAGWTELSSAVNGTPGFAAYFYCYFQCAYDNFVVSPPGHPDELWLGGAMNYEELPAYDQNGTGSPPRSNGRGVIRSTNAGGATPTWQDMTAILGDPSEAWGVETGIHPDQHAVVFANDATNTAFVGSDGGVARIDVSDPQDQSASCAERQYQYRPPKPATKLRADDLADCEMLLSGVPTSIETINDGLNTIQFQSLSINPSDPTGSLLGGTQDNGTWSYSGSPTWIESVGGDGGQSGFDPAHTAIRYHNYYDATPEVNFHGSNPRTWLAIYDPLQKSKEGRSFYVPFIADPVVGGRAFIGLEHVWRTNDNGGSEEVLTDRGCLSINLDPDRTRQCGNWIPLGGPALTGKSFGQDRLGHYVVATVRAPGDRGTMWAATRIGRVFVTSNVDAAQGTVAFHRIDSASTPGRFVSGIAVDPADANHAWVSYTGYGAYTPDTPGHVFEVRYDPATHTASWTDRSYDLGDQPITGIALHAGTGDVYVATDFGVLRLPAGASAWEQAGTGGLPHVAVYGITLSESGGVLYAATHGRGAYVLHLD